MKWKTRRKDSNAVVTLCIQFITWFRLYDFSSLKFFFFIPCMVYFIAVSQSLLCGIWFFSVCFSYSDSCLLLFVFGFALYEWMLFFFVVDDNTKLDTFVLNNSLWRYTFTKTTFWLETMTSCIYMYTLFFLYSVARSVRWVLFFFFLVTNILSPLRIRDKHHLESFHLLLCFALTLEQTRNNNTKSREKKNYIHKWSVVENVWCVYFLH